MHTYNVEQLEYLTSSTLLLTLRAKDKEHLLAFQPGQYAAFNFYRHGRPTPARCFSIVSSPTEQEVLRFSMRVRGRFTRGLSELKVGDQVDVRGPFGGFVLDLARHNDVVFIAGGIGITPFISMLEFATCVQSTTKITLLYSCASQADIPFYERISALAAQNPHISIIYVVAGGATDLLAPGSWIEGRITSEVINRFVAVPQSSKTFFICGPPPMMMGLVAILKAKGISSHNIITEAFAQGHTRQTGLIRDWPTMVYSMSAVGLAFGSIAIMVSDILRTLPPLQSFDTAVISSKESAKNQRQIELDALVNKLPAVSNTAPASSAAIVASTDSAARNAPITTTVVQPSTSAANNSRVSTPPIGTRNNQSSPSSNSQPVAAAPVVNRTPVATPAPVAATPVPVAATPPPKRCTTTQSGITKCV